MPPPLPADSACPFCRLPPPPRAAQSTLDYQYYWVSTMAGELATLAFYVWVGFNFRPHQENRWGRGAATEGDALQGSPLFH